MGREMLTSGRPEVVRRPARSGGGGAAQALRQAARRPAQAVEAVADRRGQRPQVRRLHPGRNTMLLAPDTTHAGWTIVKPNQKKRSRLASIRSAPRTPLRRQEPWRRPRARPPRGPAREAPGPQLTVATLSPVREKGLDRARSMSFGDSRPSVAQRADAQPAGTKVRRRDDRAARSIALRRPRPTAPTPACRPPRRRSARRAGGTRATSSSRAAVACCRR